MDRAQTPWSNDEICLAVIAYFDLWAAVESDSSTSKRGFIDDVAARLGRSRRSVEYRFQNISAILDNAGESYMPGYVPAKNAGSNVEAAIKKCLAMRAQPPNPRTLSKTKQEVVNEICVHIGIPSPILEKGKGSSVPSVLFDDVLTFLGIEDHSGNMPQRAQRIVEAVGMIWDPAMNSSIETTSGGGSTVTLPGLETILAAVQTRDVGGITEADEALRVGSAMRAARTEPLPLGRPCVPAPVKVVSIEAERAVRDPRVVHAVLVRANSRCESCGDEAPFVRDNGTPFLEVHHVVYLSDGGSDRQENALACCPNCHRAFHFADDRITRTERAYLENIGLIREL